MKSARYTDIMKIPSNVIFGIVLIAAGGGYELFKRNQYNTYRELYNKELALFEETRKDETYDRNNPQVRKRK